MVAIQYDVKNILQELNKHGAYLQQLCDKPVSGSTDCATAVEEDGLDFDCYFPLKDLETVELLEEILLTKTAWRSLVRKLIYLS